ncbi:hypothetical protein ACR42D_01260 [Desulfovibrio caledoniensis]
MVLLTQIFEDVIKQWPKEIVIKDCILFDDGRFVCPCLDKLFWDIDEECVHGEWGSLMCWGIFCGIKQYIKFLEEPYPCKISINKIDIGYAIYKINESIYSSDSVYWSERHKYENDLHTLYEKYWGEGRPLD